MRGEGKGSMCTAFHEAHMSLDYSCVYILKWNTRASVCYPVVRANWFCFPPPEGAGVVVRRRGLSLQSTSKLYVMLLVIKGQV